MIVFELIVLGSPKKTTFEAKDPELAALAVKVLSSRYAVKALRPKKFKGEDIAEVPSFPLQNNDWWWKPHFGKSFDESLKKRLSELPEVYDSFLSGDLRERDYFFETASAIKTQEMRDRHRLSWERLKRPKLGDVIAQASSAGKSIRAGASFAKFIK